MVSELEAAAIFPRRASEPEETIDGIMFLLQNSMMNAMDVSSWSIVSPFRTVLMSNFVAARRWCLENYQ